MDKVRRGRALGWEGVLSAICSELMSFFCALPPPPRAVMNLATSSLHASSLARRPSVVDCKHAQPGLFEDKSVVSSADSSLGCTASLQTLETLPPESAIPLLHKPHRAQRNPVSVVTSHHPSLHRTYPRCAKSAARTWQRAFDAPCPPPPQQRARLRPSGSARTSLPSSPSSLEPGKHVICGSRRRIESAERRTPRTTRSATGELSKG